VKGPSDPANFPDALHYDAASQRLFVGEGIIDNVPNAGRDYEVANRNVIDQWFSYRRKGRILDNLSSHKSPAASKALRDIGAWFLFLPPYSPDLNPIEMAFSKLKALIRKAAARTYHELWQVVGHVCGLFSDEECYNFFRAAGYQTD
jgi:transposase